MCLTLKSVKRCKYNFKLLLGRLFSHLDFIHSLSFWSLQLMFLGCSCTVGIHIISVFLQCPKGEKFSFFEICVIDLFMSQLHGIFHQKVDVCIFMAIILVLHHIVLRVFSLSLECHWSQVCREISYLRLSLISYGHFH